MTTPDAIAMAAQHPHGAPLQLWEDAMRALVQHQLEIAMLRLSHAAPDLLSEHGAKFVHTDLTLPLPGGEKVRLRANLELVE